MTAGSGIVDRGTDATVCAARSPSSPLNTGFNAGYRERRSSELSPSTRHLATRLVSRLGSWSTREQKRLFARTERR